MQPPAYMQYRAVFERLAEQEGQLSAAEKEGLFSQLDRLWDRMTDRQQRDVKRDLLEEEEIEEYGDYD